MVEKLADVDEVIGDKFLNDQQPTGSGDHGGYPAKAPLP